MVTRQLILTPRRRLLAAALGVLLAGGISAAVLVTLSPTQGPEIAGQPSIAIPHLVPDVGGLHPDSQDTSSALTPRCTPASDSFPRRVVLFRVYGGAPAGRSSFQQGVRVSFGRRRWVWPLCSTVSPSRR